MNNSSNTWPSDTPTRNSTPSPSLSQDSGFIASDTFSHASSGIRTLQMMRLVGTVEDRPLLLAVDVRLDHFERARGGPFLGCRIRGEQIDGLGAGIPLEQPPARDDENEDDDGRDRRTITFHTYPSGDMKRVPRLTAPRLQDASTA